MSSVTLANCTSSLTVETRRFCDSDSGPRTKSATAKRAGSPITSSQYRASCSSGLSVPPWLANVAPHRCMLAAISVMSTATLARSLSGSLTYRRSTSSHCSTRSLWTSSRGIRCGHLRLGGRDSQLPGREPRREPLQPFGPLCGVGNHVLVGVEHPRVQVPNTGGAGRSLGEQYDACGERSRHMWKDRPPKAVRIADRPEIAQVGLAAVEQGSLEKEQGSPERKRQRTHHRNLPTTI